MSYLNDVIEAAKKQKIVFAQNEDTLFLTEKADFDKETIDNLLSPKYGNVKSPKKKIELMEKHSDAIIVLNNVFDKQKKQIYDLLSPTLKEKDVDTYLKNVANHVPEFTYKKVNAKEQLEHEQISHKMKGVVANYCALFNFGNELYNYYREKFNAPELGRQAKWVLTAGAKTPEDVLKNVELFLTGAKEDKQKFVKEQIEKTIGVSKQMGKHRTPDEFIDFVGENISYYMASGELDGNKVQTYISNVFGLDHSKIQPILTQNNQFLNIGMNSFYLMGIYTNPFYKYLDVSTITATNYPSLMDANNPGIEYTHKDCSIPSMKSKYKNSSFVGMIKDAGLINVYKPHFMTESLNILIDKYPTATCITENGEAFSVSEEDFPERASRYLSGDPEQNVSKQRLLLKDANGKVISVLSAFDTVPQSYIDFHEAKLEIDFNNPEEAMKSIKKMVSDLDPTLVLNHSFTNVKNYVNSMEANYAKTKDFTKIVQGLSKIAGDYLSSKYQADKPNKSEITYKREEFCSKLLNSSEEYLNKVETARLQRFTIDEIIDDNQNSDDLEPFDVLNQSFIEEEKTL